MKAIRLFPSIFLPFLLFITFTLSQDVTFLISIVSVDGPSGFASPNCSEEDVRSLAFSDSRNLNGWIDAISWGDFGLAPENETLIITRNVTLGTSTCFLGFGPGNVFDQVLDSVNGSWDFLLFVMPTVADLGAAGVSCTDIDIIVLGPVGFMFKCFVPADYARAYVLSEGSFQQTNALCPCPTSPFFANCTNETCFETGDLADILQGGNELDRTLNAPNREAVLGGGTWLHVIPDLLAIEGEFEFNLTDLATGPPDEILALKIKSLDESKWLYISCRSPETIFYDDGNGSNNSTMFHIHTVPVISNQNATLETFLDVGDFFVSSLSISNDTDVIFVILRNPAPANVCSLLMVVSGFFAANGTLGGAVFDGPSSQPVFAGLFDSDESGSFILSTDDRYLPGRASVSLSLLAAPELPGPLGNSPLRRIVSSTFAERVRNSKRLDDSEGTILGNWINSSDPTGALMGFFLETTEANSSVSFDFPPSLHGPRPLFCQIFVYWMHTEDPLTTDFNASEDRFSSVPISIFGAFSDINLLLDQGKFGFGEFTGSGAQMKFLIGDIYMNANSSVVINSVLNESVSTDGVEFSCLDPLKGKIGNISLLVVDVNMTDGVYSGMPICSRGRLVEKLEEVLSRDSLGTATFEPLQITRRTLTLAEFNLSSCAYFEWARELFKNINDLDNKTLDAPPLSGVRVPNFDYIFILLPNDTGCEWDLVAGLSHPLSIITDCERAGHAFGHNLGLGHAGDENCTEPCVVEDSLMGTEKVFNAPMRIGAGWLSPDRTLEISASGEFALDRLDLSFNESLPLVLSFGQHFVSCRNASIDFHFYDSGFPAPAFYLHSQLLEILTTDSETFSFVSIDLLEVNVTVVDVSQCLVSVNIFEEFVLGACCLNVTSCFETNLISLCQNATFFPGETCDICDTTFNSTTESTTSEEIGSCCFLILGIPSCSPSFTQSTCESQPGGSFFGGVVCGDLVGCCDVNDMQCRNLTFLSCCQRNSSFYADSCIGGDPCDFGFTTITTTTITSTTITSTTMTSSSTSSSSTSSSSTSSTTTITTTTITTTTITTETETTMTSSTSTSLTTSVMTTTTLPPLVVPFEIWLLVPIFVGVCFVLAVLCLFILRGVSPTKSQSKSRARARVRKPLL